MGRSAKIRATPAAIATPTVRSGPGSEGPSPGRVAKAPVRSTMPARPNGQATPSTRADTVPRGTEPLSASPRRKRESSDVARLSPIMNRLPRGTVAEKGVGEAGPSVSRRYGSSTGLPSTVSRPCLSQQATLSPPTATTRFTMGTSPQSGSVKTTMSPRRTSEPSIRWARILSPASTVGVIDPVGTV